MRVKVLYHIMVLLSWVYPSSDTLSNCNFIIPGTNSEINNYKIIIALNSNECINCYYGMHDIFSVINYDSTLFIISGIPKREVTYFFEQKLNLQTKNIKWIQNDSLFRQYTGAYNGESAIYILLGSEIIFSSDLKNPDREKLFELLQSPPSKKLLESTEWDITNFGGDSNSSLNFLNKDTVLIYNPTRNKIYLYSLSLQQLVKIFDIGLYPENLGDWLALTELEPIDLNFAKSNKEAKEYISSMNRIIPGSPYVTERYVFVPIQILAYDLEITSENDTTVLLKWYSFLAQYNKQLDLISRYAFTYQIEGFPNHFNHLDNANFLNDSILYMKPSTRVKDSIIAIYKLLPGRNPELIKFPPVAYPDRFPMKVGPYAKVYYSDFISETEYYFKEEPILYNCTTGSSMELSDWQYTSIGDSTRTGFWVEHIIKIQDMYFVFGIVKKSTILKVYDKNFNLQHSELVIDEPYFSINVHGNTIYGLISDDVSIKVKSFTLNTE